MAFWADDKGFSLLELMVAVAILGTAGVALVSSQSSAMHAANQLSDKTLAVMVAENQLNEALAQEFPPAAGVIRGNETQMGQAFNFTRRITTLQNGTVQLVNVSVQGDGGNVLASLSGLREAKP